MDAHLHILHPTLWLQISAVKGGEQHTLVLTKKGQVLAFGASTYGMLGR